jgi:spore germination protein
VNQGIIAVILSIVFYLTSLLGGSGTQQTTPNHQFFQAEQQVASSVMGRRAVTLGDNISLRSGPDVKYPSVTALKGGAEVTVLQAENGWYKVRYAPGRDAWIPGSSVALKDSQDEEGQETMVLGYYFLGGESFTAMLEHGQALTSISPWSWALTANGSLAGDFDPKALGESLLFAGNHGLKTYALVHAAGEEQLEALLTSTDAQHLAVANIKRALKEWGVHGVHLHLTEVPTELKGEFTAFIENLGDALSHSGLETSVAVPAAGGGEAYDYAALAQHVDFIVLLAYGQHGPGTTPGPIASAEWVEEVVQRAVSQVDPQKLVLAIPSYGYNWPEAGGAHTITHSEAVELAATEGIKIRWHSQYKTPYFTHNGGEAWFENRFSVQAKLQIVSEYGLKGVALWPLGQEDEGIWKILEQHT